MKDLIEHIDALIMEYDCVIIPDFGGFVLNKESALVGEVILPPSVSVGFNPALKHNDGLLAESYMKSKSISYDAACKHINEAVKKINGFLSAKQPVIFPKIGTFSSNEESAVVFTPIKNKLQHPTTIGYTPVGLRRLDEIAIANKSILREYKQLGIKRTFAGVAATAAAVLLFFTISTPIKDVGHTQKGSFFTSGQSITNATQQQMPTSANIEASAKTVDEIDVRRIEKEEKATSSDNNSKTNSLELKPQKIANDRQVESVENIKTETPSTAYYIIVGSCPTDNEAKRMVQNLKGDGFRDALIVPSKSRTRVAIAHFNDKTVAERYLNNFRSEYSEFGDAWLLTSRHR